MSRLSTSLVPWSNTSRPVARPSGLTIVTVADLTLRVDDRVATYKLNGQTVTVFRPGMGMTVPELAELVKTAPREAEYSDMNPWIEPDAYALGLRVEF